MSWRDFQEENDALLAEVFGGDRVLHEPVLPSGSRPDHVVLGWRGTVESIYDSKDKAMLTHADVTQLLRYDAELGPRNVGFIVRDTTAISPSVAERIDATGIGVVVQGDDEDETDARDLGAGLAALGAGGIAYAIAKENGAKNPKGWGLLAGFVTLLLTAR